MLEPCRNKEREIEAEISIENFAAMLLNGRREPCKRPFVQGGNTRVLSRHGAD